MVISLDQNFKEFLSLLEFQNVEYLLIGGYAVNWHGYHRATNDTELVYTGH